MNKIADELVKIAKQLSAGSFKKYTINGNKVHLTYEHPMNRDFYFQGDMENVFKEVWADLRFAKSKYREIGLVSGTINPPMYTPSSNVITASIQFTMAQPLDVIVMSLQDEGFSPL